MRGPGTVGMSWIGGGRRRNGCRVAAAWADVQRTREGR